MEFLSSLRSSVIRNDDLHSSGFHLLCSWCSGIIAVAYSKIWHSDQAIITQWCHMFLIIYVCVCFSVCGCAVVCIYVIYIYVCFCVFTVHESGVSVNKTITVLPVWPCCTVPFTITCCSFALCFFWMHLPEIHRFTTSSHESDPPRFHHFIHLVSKEWTKIRQWGATAVANR